MSDESDIIPFDDPIDCSPTGGAVEVVEGRARALRHRDRLLRAGAIVGVVAMVFGTFAIVSAQDGGRDRRTVAPATDTEHEHRATTTRPATSTAAAAVTTAPPAATSVAPASGNSKAGSPPAPLECPGLSPGQMRIHFTIHTEERVEGMLFAIDGKLVGAGAPVYPAGSDISGDYVVQAGEHTISGSGNIRNGGELPNGAGYQLDRYEASSRINLTECDQSYRVTLAVTPPPMTSYTIQLPHDFTWLGEFGPEPVGVVPHAITVKSYPGPLAPCAVAPVYPAVCTGYSGYVTFSGRPVATTVTVRVPQGRFATWDAYSTNAGRGAQATGIVFGDPGDGLDETVHVHGMAPTRVGHTLRLTVGPVVTGDSPLRLVDAWILTVVKPDGSYDFGYPPAAGTADMGDGRAIYDADDPGAGALASWSPYLAGDLRRDL